MNDDELRKLWQHQPLRQPDLSMDRLISAMKGRMTGFRRTVFWRDIGELLACAVVVGIFGVFYLRDARWPVSRVGELIVIGSAIFIGIRLIYARRTTPPAPVDATVVESLRAELKSVRAQSRLLGSIAWWYLLPLGTGVLVCTWGKLIDGLGSFVFNIIYTIGVIALYVFIHRLNRMARVKNLLPLEAQLQSLLRSAETGEPPEENEMTNLRSIAVSIATAAKAKPVEFKVALWQIAIFGEIGFIGIWFFLMLGLAGDNGSGKNTERAATQIQQSASAPDTNRYSVVVRQIVELLNAKDYDGVEKLYNPGMSRSFPPDETSDFYERLTTRFGKVENVENVATNGYRGWPAFRLHCQHGELTMSLALDADSNISGIYFQPAPKPDVDILTRIRRVFIWQHLVWIAPFFLAGLFYSWLLQKWTGSAVGISALGIHLHKGQTLILWGEITEVRPFKFLYIRNLWLIKESGEKTLMHWTPLERHSDVKAALESFAPADHPIREYMSLLR